MNIFVINKDTMESIGRLDFLPRTSERLILDVKGWSIEYVVGTIVHNPKENAVLVFVKVVEPYYETRISEIRF